MRVRHVEQLVAGLWTMQPEHPGPLGLATWEAERIRHLLWNGYWEEAFRSVNNVGGCAGEIRYLNGEAFEEKTRRLHQLCVSGVRSTP